MPNCSCLEQERHHTLLLRSREEQQVGGIAECHRRPRIATASPVLTVVSQQNAETFALRGHSGSPHYVLLTATCRLSASEDGRSASQPLGNLLPSLGLLPHPGVRWATLPMGFPFSFLRETPWRLPTRPHGATTYLVSSLVMTGGWCGVPF